jgi:serine/threonine-protein kinase HipA
MRVGEQEADATLDNAMSMCTLFALKRDEAAAEVRRVCEVVRGWQAHFAAQGVRPRDVESLAPQIDRPFLREQREGF